ncbi:MAG: acyltransferase [Caulobacteraceae bacterium]|nr:acyltransferase [Caulobacteraceae bacterium]
MVENLKPLTSLRFFAALWVVLFTWWPKGDFGASPALFEKGYLGVDLFFILSGFILCHVYLAQAGEGRFRYGSFLWNRLARIYPLHLFTIAVLALLGVGAGMMGMTIDPNILSWKTLPQQLTLTHAWGLTNLAGWNHPSWSISAEWFAYLTFPIFAAAAWSLEKRPRLASVLALGALFGAYSGYRALTGEELTEATFMGGAFRIVPAFAYGSALYLLWRARLLADVRVAWGVLGLSVAAAGVSASLWGPDVLTVALFGPVVLSLASLSEAKRNPLASAPLVYLGEASYSIYMLCIPWQLFSVHAASTLLGVDSDQLPLWVWIPLVALLPVVAAISYQFIEKPARLAMKGFSARRPRESTTPQVA